MITQFLESTQPKAIAIKVAIIVIIFLLNGLLDAHEAQVFNF